MCDPAHINSVAAENEFVLVQSQESSNQSDTREQQKGFQDPYTPRVIVHPIFQQSPHRRTRQSKDCASESLGRRDPLACLTQLTDHVAMPAPVLSASVRKRPLRNICRVCHRPRRRCWKSAPPLRCRWSALLLRAQLLVTFSFRRSFLIVDDKDDPRSVTGHARSS